MDQLTKQENDLLRDQEWRLLFEDSSSISVEHVPEEFSRDTFMIKTQFSVTSVDKHYLVLLTNFKQLWVEKLEEDDIRKRAKKIRTFDYEEDSQIEALLLSLSGFFSADKPSSEGSDSNRKLKGREENKLSLFVEFAFGIGTLQWEFKLVPMVTPAMNAALSLTQPTQFGTSLHSRLNSATKAKRGRLFLEDSEEDEDEDEESANSHSTYETAGTRSLSQGRERERGGREEEEHEDGEEPELIDGTSVIYDHLVLPLIAIANAYRRQVKIQENVIKAKENEVFEALEMLDQNGINYRSRRRETEPYVKEDADHRLQTSLELLRQPQLKGPRELFSDPAIAKLCSIVTKNAKPKASQLDPNSLSQYPGMSLPMSMSSSSASGGRRLGMDGASLAAVHEEQVAPKTSLKVDQELERRRALEEKLEKEKIALEKSRKKKKIF
ncbi:hypothetical protein BG004_004789 [Podila humilis]|nr:hypothetical protein BG004_004789 [Podila humilis]